MHLPCKSSHIIPCLNALQKFFSGAGEVAWPLSEFSSQKSHGVVSNPCNSIPEHPKIFFWPLHKHMHCTHTHTQVNLSMRHHNKLTKCTLQSFSCSLPLLLPLASDCYLSSIINLCLKIISPSRNTTAKDDVSKDIS